MIKKMNGHDTGGLRCNERRVDVQALRRSHDDPEVVGGHLAARRVERRILLCCAGIASVGVVILLGVVTANTLLSGPQPASAMREYTKPIYQSLSASTGTSPLGPD